MIDSFIELNIVKNYNIYDLITNKINLSKVDLCISLEVAEHLPENFADNFIDLLVSLSDYVLLFLNKVKTPAFRRVAFC